MRENGSDNLAGEIIELWKGRVEVCKKLKYHVKNEYLSALLSRMINQSETFIDELRDENLPAVFNTRSKDVINDIEVRLTELRHEKLDESQFFQYCAELDKVIIVRLLDLLASESIAFPLNVVLLQQYEELKLSFSKILFLKQARKV